MYFDDRHDAGRRLGAMLAGHVVAPHPAVLGLPRGGVPVAAEVAVALRGTLDVLVVRKLGVPGQEELAMGAVASGGAMVRNDDVIHAARVGEQELARIVERERRVVAERDARYRRGRPPVEVSGRDVIVVDDGLATGATMRVAVRALWQRDPARVVVAVPVGTRQVCRAVGQHADEVVCLYQPRELRGVGAWYRDFSPTGDDEVAELLRGS
ncbi:MAG: phosphoribosyltransferase [Pseudonocardiaceae bacterium]